MRKIIIEFITCLIAISCAAGTVFSGESVTIVVSCTIPALPGINAQPFEKMAQNALAPESNKKELEKKQNVKEEGSESIFIVQEDYRQDPVSIEGLDMNKKVSTLYSR